MSGLVGSGYWDDGATQDDAAPWLDGPGGVQVSNPSGPVLISNAIVVKPAPFLGYSAPQALAGFGPDNLAIDQPTSFRTTALSSDTYRFYVSLAEPFDTIALMNTNLSEAATIEIMGCSSVANGNSGGGTMIVPARAARASANLPQRSGYHVLLALADPVQYPWLRITISGALPFDMLYAEHLVVGLNRRTKNMSVDSTEAGIDLGSFERARDGTVDRQRGYRLRHVEFDISTLEEAQYQVMLADLTMSINDPMFVVPNSKSGAFLHDRMLYGTFTSSKVAKAANIRMTRSFAIDSLI